MSAHATDGEMLAIARRERAAKEAAALLPPSRWVPLDDVLAVVRDPRWTWTRNSQCKYLDLRLDTRDGRVFVCDRDGRPIGLEDLRRQGETQLAPVPLPSSST